MDPRRRIRNQRVRCKPAASCACVSVCVCAYVTFHVWIVEGQVFRTSRKNDERSPFSRAIISTEVNQPPPPAYVARAWKMVISFVFFRGVPPFIAPMTCTAHAYTRAHMHTYCHSHIALSPPQTHAPCAPKELSEWKRCRGNVLFCSSKVGPNTLRPNYLFYL